MIGLLELWIGFGTGKAYKGHDKCMALPFFHAFTGCDVTSSGMVGIRKKTGWTAWQSFPEVKNTMITLTENPIELREDSIHMHSHRDTCLTVIVYSKACSCETVNEARQSMFTHNLKSIDSIPSIKAASFQHTKRTVLVGCLVYLAPSIEAITLSSKFFSVWMEVE